MGSIRARTGDVWDPPMSRESTIDGAPRAPRPAEDDASADELLARYHAEPGRTVQLHERWRDDHGRTSYEVPVEALAPTGRVLDLACGDGYLLAMLERRGRADLVGVDRSVHGLAAARERLGPGVELVGDDARALSLLDQSWFTRQLP